MSHDAAPDGGRGRAAGGPDSGGLNSGSLNSGGPDSGGPDSGAGRTGGRDTGDQDIDGFFSTARVAARPEAVELPTDGHTRFLFDLDDPKLTSVRGMDYEEFTRDRYKAPFLQELLASWRALYDEPFTGVTSDGVVRPGLYDLPEHPVTDPAPQQAAQRLLAVVTDEERRSLTHPVTAREWRAWSNPEFVVHRVGLRLENLAEATVAAVLGVVRASLSPEGYARVTGAMELNAALGELVDLPAVMNARSYWFSLFGTPDPLEPWGWQLFGHHVAVNFVSVGGRHVIAPVFLGGEPALTDEHPPLFAGREATALALAGSLTARQRERAVVYASVLDPAMPAGRLHPADERHVAGAFQDNRVIPYEGIPAGELTAEQSALLRAVVADFLLLPKEPQREATLAGYDAHLDDTWFAWYGATDGSQPFYLRVHSPVVIAELDHHAGVWLSNRLPARFHVHTTLRYPNGNDYGRALVARWREREGGRGSDGGREAEGGRAGGPARGRAR
ncbi:hypothetical protein RVR_1604 [Actinacidiphila reveromycinica]|uniref:DUF3500 domain-containing protein n=1 Tax=Actinacidiphila reveromycinica TaxID=659352 RepID=A0A7U3UPN2_9ACTN|nr:DUF3500 domain-containing protein [Streptomyces sp. SN-593]BBA96346.1 hypothetical protein RVR_1604 [Streptomyces sp. SN-593]